VTDEDGYTTVVTEPGVYRIREEVYHADPVPGGSLSSSWAKKILTPNTPAHFAHERKAGGVRKREFDFGRAAHLVVLGEGGRLHVIEEDNYRSAEARFQREYAYENGLTPLLAWEYAAVLAMADALRSNELASALFPRQRYENGELIPAGGAAELSLFWRDQVTGVMLRCRLDWAPYPVAGHRFFVPDYKTCDSAAPQVFAKAVASYRYNLQAAWNSAGIEALGMNQGSEIVFPFVCQEKTAPYLTAVHTLSAVSLDFGRRRMRQAIDLYARCVEAGEWPGYGAGVNTLELPAWFEKTEEEELSYAGY
jgi:hypothetical protein